MLKTTINNVEYKVEMVHETLKNKKVTFCFILENDNLISQGEVHQFIKDKYNRYKGNLEAFKKATNKLSNKEVKTLLWKEYLSHTDIKKIYDQTKTR